MWNHRRSARDPRTPALVVLCAGFLMVVLDTTAVNVALPTIGRDLGVSEASLAWVVNAYLVAFGGLLLLAGRVGDLVGRRRVFLAGLAVFVAASAAGGVATSVPVLVAARFVQGAGGAPASAVVLGMIAALFPRPAERARAIGAYAFVGAAGASIGLVLGGVLTQALSWHWVLFVNVPIGLATMLAAARVLASEPGAGLGAGADVPGAVLVTSGLMLGVAAIVESLLLAVPAVALLAAFAWVESRAEAPLVPGRILRSRPLVAGALVQLLMIGGYFGQQFVVALYLQRELGYDPAGVGLATVPVALVIGATSLAVAPRLVGRLGAARTLAAGLTLGTVGLALLLGIDRETTFAGGLLPAFVVMGAGGGLALPAATTLIMSGAEERDAGLASGFANTTQQVGGALGLAVMAAVLEGPGGYRGAVAVAVGLVAAALVAALLYARSSKETMPEPSAMRATVRRASPVSTSCSPNTP
jgi:EmrB/QacA subfamily drug resistance transporter